MSNYGLTEDDYKIIYENFKRLSSVRPKFSTFKKNVNKFFEFTFNAYIKGVEDRNKSYKKWVDFIGNKDIARIYFIAIDSWQPYT